MAIKSTIFRATLSISDLDRGYYTVEVYATRFTRPGERVWKGERLYNERIYFDGRGVKDIFVDDRHANVRPGRPGQGEHRPNYDRHDRVMNDQLFKTFYNNLKKENLQHLCVLIEDVYSDRKNIVETVLTIVKV